MNPEELKQLKPGDEIFIRAKYKESLEDGDVSFSHSFTNSFGEVIKTNGYTHSKNIILPPPAPKYDPCRKFRKGDKVRVVERYGRKFWNAAPETIYTVVEDEYLHDDQNVLHRGCVGINDGKPETLSSWNIPFFHVELVTPVEELYPYSVCQDAEMECFEVYKCEYTEGEEGDEKVWKIVRTTYFYGDKQGLRTLAEAKEAAEAECARLNAEYRKKQNNGMGH